MTNDSAIRRFGWRVVAPILGSPGGAKVSEALVKILLRGIGVNVGYQLEESGERWFVKRLLQVCRGAVCADIGANVGTYSSLLLASGAGPVVAFEPVPSTFAELERRFAGVSSFRAIHAAVGETRGDVEIHLPTAGGSSKLASRDRGVASLAETVSYRVPMVTLDSVCFDEGVTFDFVKIDVEGFELEVLRGANRTLAQRPPAALQIEFNRHHMLRRHHIGDFFDALPGYRLFRLAPRSFFPLRRDHYLSTIYTFQNLVAVRRDRADLLTTFCG